MASISLRSYNREIGSLIDNLQIDEAVAHCRHILKSYPKHVDTYRLLGKAYLEGERYGDAVDVLQRILSSVPDDFISHLGMSIIREDEGNLDQAIWHMERAFEIQPANSAIQDELRRLYGRRDGVEPPKIRLTRGALARMYVKGDLYQQAVAELRSALAEDPQRIDLQVLLARVCALSGQRVEAAETSSEVLRKLHYCLEANQIMVEVLTSSDRAADAAPYRQRLQALDPYSAFLSPSIKESSKVPDESVTLEKLEWEPGMAAIGRSPQSEWASSIGVDLVDFTSSDIPIPDWLKSDGEAPVDETSGDETPAGEASTNGQKSAGGEPAESVETPSGSTPAQASAWETLSQNAAGTPARPADEEPPAQPTPAEEMPEWMKAAGWGLSSGTAEDQAAASSFEVDDLLMGPVAEAGELAEAEIPDWLKAMAPTPDDDETQGDQEGYSWLKDILNKAESETSPAEVTAEEGTPSEEVSEPPAAGWYPAGAEEPVAEETPAEEGPDWFTGSSFEKPTGQAEVPPAETEDSSVEAFTSDWIWESSEDEEMVAPEAGHEPAGLDSESPDLDWLRELEGELATEGDTEPVQLGSTAPSPAVLSFDEPGSKQAGEIEEAGQTPAEGIPDWLLELPDETTPDWPGETVSSSQPETGAGALVWPEIDDLPEEEIEPSVDAVEAGAAVQEAEMAAPAEESLDAELPEWLRGTEEPEAVEPPAEATVEGAIAEDAAIQAAVIAAGAKENLEEELPEWLRAMEEPAAVEQAPEAAFEAPVEEDATVQEPEMAATAGTETVSEISLEDRLKELGGPPIEGDTKPVRIKAAQVFDIAPEDADTAETEPAAALPDWLQETPEETVPDWLQETLVIGQPEVQAEPPEMAAMESETEVETEAETEMALPEQAVPEGETAPDEIPDWFSQVPESPDDSTMTGETAEAPPEWIGAVAYLVEEPASGEAASTEAESEDVARELAFDLGDTEASFAWLESLAAMQAVEQDQPPMDEELQEAIPDWMQETSQAAAEQPVEDQVEAGAQLEAEAQPEAESQAEPPVTIESEFEPAEISAMEPQEEPEAETQAAEAELETPAPPDTQAALEPILTGMEEEQIPELPDWLSDEKAEKSEEEEEEWTPTEVTLPVAPQYPLDLNTASLTELERLPGIGFIMAQEIIDYRERSGPFTNLEDLRQVPGLDESILEDMHGYLKVQAPQAAAVAPAIEEDESHIELIAARNALIQGSLEQAIDRYASLVKNRQFLGEVIRELQEATIRYPVEISIWQTLGDAYLRTDQLQEALDAYNKAEELLS